ncbi:MAG: crosslink repair DNA glycosylase YcaQ family protein [Pseudomonadota bacterium]
MARAPAQSRNLVPRLGNAEARALFLQRHDLHKPPSGSGRGAGLADLIERLGFVQVDSVNTLARAHDLILWSRRPNYRAASLRWLNDRTRQTFESWTHDAAILPMNFYPYWRLKFARDRDRIESKWLRQRGPEFLKECDTVLEAIARNGAICSRDMSAGATRPSTGWWDWHPSKTALEYLWRSGRLAICHRRGFAKYFDLAENVVPAEYLNAFYPDRSIVDWGCEAALNRLGLATSGEIASFFALVTPQEAKAWLLRALADGRVIEVDVTSADGSLRRHAMRPETLADLPGPVTSKRMRILSPFDPALRDRKRAERLFGFHYRIEIFVPEAQRRYGYYVFPVMQGQRLIGRIDIEADRPRSVLKLRRFWPESGMRMGKAQITRLWSELARMARWQNLTEIEAQADWLQPEVIDAN